MTVPCLRADSPRDLSSFETRRERAMYTALIEIDALTSAYAYAAAPGDAVERAVAYVELICRAHSVAHAAVRAATDPVITNPRPSWHTPAKGSMPGIRGEDVLPCDVEQGDDGGEAA